MFNLEQAISGWRRHMLAAGIKNPDVIDELESHLREDVAQQVQSGENAEQAFEAAVQRVGRAGVLKREFAKLRGIRWVLLRKLRLIFVRYFVPFPSSSTFAPSARWTLEHARKEAPRLHHSFVGTEHVLLGLLALESGVVPNVLKRMGVDRAGLRKQVEDWVTVVPSKKMVARLPYTPRVKRSLQLAVKEAKASQHSCGTEHMFLGLLLEGDGVAGRVLRNLGLSSETTREEIMRELGRNKCGS